MGLKPHASTLEAETGIRCGAEVGVEKGLAVVCASSGISASRGDVTKVRINNLLSFIQAP
jgi:hypothetical protein